MAKEFEPAWRILTRNKLYTVAEDASASPKRSPNGLGNEDLFMKEHPVSRTQVHSLSELLRPIAEGSAFKMFAILQGCYLLSLLHCLISQWSFTGKNEREGNCRRCTCTKEFWRIKLDCMNSPYQHVLRVGTLTVPGRTGGKISC